MTSGQASGQKLPGIEAQRGDEAAKNPAIGRWYCFVVEQWDGRETFEGIYQYLGDGIWADEHEALDETPDYDRLVLQ